MKYTKDVYEALLSADDNESPIKILCNKCTYHIHSLMMNHSHTSSINETLQIKKLRTNNSRISTSQIALFYFEITYVEDYRCQSPARTGSCTMRRWRARPRLLSTCNVTSGWTIPRGSLKEGSIFESARFHSPCRKTLRVDTRRWKILFLF